MGLGDKLKGLRKQAEEAVVEHKDQIHGAVEAAGAAVDKQTKGKYTDKIAKFEQKAGDAVDKLGDQAPGEEQADKPEGA